jgi:hypothetical protein
MGMSLAVAGWAQTYEPYNCEWSLLYRESYSTYVCPAGKVIAGRVHYGDEDGSTHYNCCNVRPTGSAANLALTSCSWSGSVKESSGINFFCPSNKVMAGRFHSEDENGNTQYYCCNLDDAGLLLTVNAPTCAWSFGIKESSGFTYTCPWPKLMVGRAHYGTRTARRTTTAAKCSSDERVGRGDLLPRVARRSLTPGDHGRSQSPC